MPIFIHGGRGSYMVPDPRVACGPIAPGSMLRYSIGLMLFIPCNIIIKKSLPEDGNDVERDLVAGLLTAGALGTGTLLGHFLDGLAER